MKAIMLSGHGGYTVRQGLESFFGAENVEALFAKDLLTLLAAGRGLPDLIVFPGGSSSQMAEDLGDWGKEIIRGYVAGGGKFLGICAGATFGATSARFTPQGFAPLARDRNFCLELLPVEAAGPLPAPEGYAGPYSQGIETLTDCPLLHDNRPLEVYYGGGCAFHFAPGADVQALAHFQRLCATSHPSAAIVQGAFHAGQVILSAAHPDTKWDHMRYMHLRLVRGDFKLTSQVRPNPAEDFMAQSMKSIVEPANQSFFRPPSEWFHDLLLSHFMGCQPRHSYADFRPPGMEGPAM